jgi:hypothetical protein
VVKKLMDTCKNEHFDDPNFCYFAFSMFCSKYHHVPLPLVLCPFANTERKYGNRLKHSVKEVCE